MKFSKYLLLSCILVSCTQTSLEAKTECCNGKNSRKETTRTRKAAHITVAAHLPGIIGLLDYRPETAKPLLELAQALLVKDSTLTRGERELIAAYVSSLNKCNFCCDSHTAAAEHLLGDEAAVVAQVKSDLASAPVSEKMRALLVIAGKVQKDARTVSDEDVAQARAHGATDLEIHDAVLIAAAFCMYNRYVDGLGTVPAPSKEVYDAMGAKLAAEGYLAAGR
jgi:uncharacterized peroxidase-related enzyme